MSNHEGNPLHEVQGSDARLNDSQFAAYNAAFETIDRDLSAMKPVREALSRLEHVQWERPMPKSFQTITTPEGTWTAHALLLKLFRTQVLLCRKLDGNEWVVIQQLESPQGRLIHGEHEILLKGNDVRQLATKYMAQMRHTLRFMARNAEVKAQKIVWEQVPENNPGEVVRAISELCTGVVEGKEVIKQEQTQSMRKSQSRGIGI
jgi:hypothetical protein